MDGVTAVDGIMMADGVMADMSLLAVGVMAVDGVGGHGGQRIMLIQGTVGRTPSRLTQAGIELHRRYRVV